MAVGFEASTRDDWFGRSLPQYNPVYFAATGTEVPPKDENAHFVRKLNETLAWKARMGADFRLRFDAPLRQLRDEIQVRCGLSDHELDEAIARASSKNCEPKIVQEVLERLWNMALPINN